MLSDEPPPAASAAGPAVASSDHASKSACKLVWHRARCCSSGGTPPGSPSSAGKGTWLLVGFAEQRHLIKPMTGSVSLVLHHTRRQMYRCEASGTWHAASECSRQAVQRRLACNGRLCEDCGPPCSGGCGQARLGCQPAAGIQVCLLWLTRKLQLDVAAMDAVWLMVVCNGAMRS